MPTLMMLLSNTGRYVIDIQGDSTQAGASLDCVASKVGILSGSSATQIAANQAWEVLPDPAGSTHHIIKNPATGHCIDIRENSLQPGAALDAYPAKSSNNGNQLWDFLPDPFGSGSCFIQNPQTGYVIAIGDNSALVVNPRQLFGNDNQLWSYVQLEANLSFGKVALPSLTMAPAPSGLPLTSFGSNSQYVLLAPNQATNLKSVVVTIDIVQDLITDSFSIQINGNAPAPSDGSGAVWDAQWLQYGLVMQDNSLALWNQVWHALGPDKPGDPLASVDETSPPLMSLQNNTVPAGTRIVLMLTIDQSHDDFSTGLSGQVYRNGSPVGTARNWSVIGQPTFNPGGPVQESDLSPLGALSVVIVGPPGGTANFSSGLGTITVASSPAVTVSSQLNGPNPHGIQTGEQSNMYYGLVQQGSFEQVVQPFGVLSPKITGVVVQTPIKASGNIAAISGTGLYPNSMLTATAQYGKIGTISGPGGTSGAGGSVAAKITSGPGTSGADGSFAFDIQWETSVTLPDLGVTVTDSQGNTAWGIITFSGVISQTGGTQRTAF